MSKDDMEKGKMQNLKEFFQLNWDFINLNTYVYISDVINYRDDAISKSYGLEM